jgi:hypothetical protein
MEKKATIQYLLSEEGRKKSFLNGGNGEMVQYLTVECTDEIISMIEKSLWGSILINIEPILYIGFDGYDDFGNPDYMKWKYVEYIEDLDYLDYELNIHYFDKLMSAIELIEWQKERLEILASEEKVIMDDFKVRENRRIEKFNRQRNKWINQYGTPELKAMNDNDKNINQMYLKERINKELPGFEIKSYEYLNEAVNIYPYGYKPNNTVENEFNLLKEKGFEVYSGVLDANNWYDQNDYDEAKIIEVLYIEHYLGKYFLEKKFK